MAEFSKYIGLDVHKRDDRGGGRGRRGRKRALLRKDSQQCSSRKSATQADEPQPGSGCGSAMKRSLRVRSLPSDRGRPTSFPRRLEIRRGKREERWNGKAAQENPRVCYEP